MSYEFRCATSSDLANLADLIHPAEIEGASFIDDPDDCVLLAFALGDWKPKGAVRLRRNIGSHEPRYWYHVGTRVHAAPDLAMFRRERTLLLGNDLTGAMEIAALKTNETDVDRCRLLQHELIGAAIERLLAPGHRSDLPRIIAPLQGVRHDGVSPFWEGLGRAFFPGDPEQARRRFGERWVTHVAALLPKHPLVVSILPESAQSAIGQVPDAATSYRDALLAHGFVVGQHVSVDDGGSVLELHPSPTSRR